MSRNGESESLAAEILATVGFRSRFMGQPETKPPRRSLDLFFSDSDSGDFTPKSTRPATRQPLTLNKSQTLNETPTIRRGGSGRRQASVSNSARQVSDENAPAKEKEVAPKVRRRVSGERAKQSDSGVEHPRPRKIRSHSVQRARPKTQQVTEPVVVPMRAPRKAKVVIDNVVSLDLYFAGERPQPYTGERVAVLNGAELEAVFPQEEEKQYVKQVAAPKTVEPKAEKKSGNPTVDKVLATLFLDADDAGIEFFNLDFARAYVTDQKRKELVEEAKTYVPNMGALQQVPSGLAEKARDPESVGELLRVVFDARVRGDVVCLTSIRTPLETDVDLNGDVLDAIAPAAFFDFRLGKFDASDRLHVFTWHKLGIPALQIARNLGALVKNAQEGCRLESVVQYVFTWLYCFPTDFYDDPHCSEVVLQVMKLVIAKDKEMADSARILKALIFELQEKRRLPEEYCCRLPEPTIKDSSDSLDLMSLAIEPSVLAVHLTYLELELLHKLQRGELVGNKWTDYPPHLRAVVDRFNETVAFIASSILVDTQKGRIKNIHYWVRVMKEAKKLHNFQLIAEIDAALSSLPIARLKGTWKAMKNGVISQFQNLHNLCENKTYWSDVFSAPRKTVPFIGVFLSELARIGQDPPKKPMKSGSDGYDMSLQRQALSLVEFMFNDWGCDLQFELDARILEECKVLSGKARRPEELILPSVHCEPLRTNEKRFVEKFVQETSKQ